MQCGAWTRIPIPYTHGFLADENDQILYRTDKNGDVSILKSGAGKASVGIVLVKEEASRLKMGAPETPVASSERFTEETERAIAEIAKAKQGNRARGYALARYAMQRLQYSNESQFNSTYRSDPNGYCFAIDTHKKADCDVGIPTSPASADRSAVPRCSVFGRW